MFLDRSLNDKKSYYEQKYESRLIALERLVEGGNFLNVRQMIASSWWPSIPRFFRVICSMTNLEKIELMNLEMALIEEDLARLFRSCPKLTELHLALCDLPLETNEELKNELRSGCQRLKIFELHWDIVSCPIIQEILM